MKNNYIFSIVSILSISGLTSQLISCASGSYAAQDAAEGGTTGAISGAVGITAGVISGSKADKKYNKQMIPI